MVRIFRTLGNCHDLQSQSKLCAYICRNLWICVHVAVVGKCKVLNKNQHVPYVVPLILRGENVSTLHSLDVTDVTES